MRLAVFTKNRTNPAANLHTNFSLSKNGKNIFHEPKGEHGMSKIAWDFILRLLNHAPEICLVLNPSVNSYRRLDPHFEAPNERPSRDR